MNLADFSWYTGNLSWLPGRTIFLTKHGSHAYGTNLPTSDLDLKGIAIAPKEYYLGTLNTFEQAEVRAPLDAVIYDIKKFFRLAWDCNPNIIEVLYTDESDWIFPTPTVRTATTDLWWRIHGNRDLFLSQKARHTFSGYAVAQLKRIQTHRAWLLNPPKKKPERSDFGLSNAEGTLGRDQLGVINARIQKLADNMAGQGWTKDEVEAVDPVTVEHAVKELNLDANLVDIIVRERKFASAARYFDAFQKWKTERNPKRAELEAKFGYDTKHAMHLVRLLRMAKEILGEGKVVVKRPDAEDLLRIRAGDWAYDDLIQYAKSAELDLEVIAHHSPLPKAPDRNALDQLLVRLVRQSLG